MNTINKKIICKHCKQIIGFEHMINSIDYKSNTILSPNKFGTISKSKIRGSVNVDSFGDCNKYVGYELETQFKCLKCNKKTSILTINEY